MQRVTFLPITLLAGIQGSEKQSKQIAEKRLKLNTGRIDLKNQ